MTKKLKASTDRKTANSATPSGKTARIKNAFGLPSGKQFSCPGATTICETVCYAGRMEKQYKNVLAAMLHNWDIVRNSDHAELVALFSDMLDEFVQACDKWNAEKKFRIHHDGDFWGPAYTLAWHDVMLAYPNVQFWAYTRSFHLVNLLADTPNLTLYLSVDKVNLTKAIQTYDANPWVKLAALGQTFDDAKELLAAFGERGVRCPELNGAIPLITVNGGACLTCGLCIDGRGNVTFSSSKR